MTKIKIIFLVSVGIFALFLFTPPVSAPCCEKGCFPSASCCVSGTGTALDGIGVIGCPAFISNSIQYLCHGQLIEKCGTCICQTDGQSPDDCIWKPNNQICEDEIPNSICVIEYYNNDGKTAVNSFCQECTDGKIACPDGTCKEKCDEPVTCGPECKDKTPVNCDSKLVDEKYEVSDLTRCCEDGEDWHYATSELLSNILVQESCAKTEWYSIEREDTVTYFEIYRIPKTS